MNPNAHGLTHTITREIRRAYGQGVRLFHYQTRRPVASGVLVGVALSLARDGISARIERTATNTLFVVDLAPSVA